MDRLDFLTNEQLLQFLHCKKTEMSVLEPHHIFLNQLRDKNLLPEDMYWKVIRSKSTHLKQKGLYNLLDWLERERPENIRRFWQCVFEKQILQQYHTLRQLHNDLIYGSFSETISEARKEDPNKRKKTPEGGNEEKKQKKIVKQKKKTRTESSEEEQAGPSSMQTPRKRKKVQKPTFDSLTTRKNRNICSKGPSKTKLPVECGGKKGTLSKERLARGEKCILVKDKWFTPADFEVFGGMERSKNWKKSIRHEDTPLAKLIKEGVLKSPKFKRNRNNIQKSKRTLFSSNQSESSITDSLTTRKNRNICTKGPSKTKLPVECGGKKGTLSKERLARGEECILVKDKWFTPADFEVFGGMERSKNWKRSIRHEDTPLAKLIKEGVLKSPKFKGNSVQKSKRTLFSSNQSESSITDSESEEDEEEEEESDNEEEMEESDEEEEESDEEEEESDDEEDKDKEGGIQSDTGEIQCEGWPVSSLTEEEQRSDVCFICKSQGHLVMCDKCPRSYHQKCHLPSMDDTVLEDDSEWVCTVCVYLTSQEWFHKNQNTLQEAQTFLVSNHVLQCQYLLMYMYNADKEQIFSTHPCLQVKDYTRVIKTPMWLDKVKERLEQDHYQTVQQFMTDVLLIFDNCAIFNRGNDEIQEIGENLRDLFVREFKKVFQVQQ